MRHNIELQIRTLQLRLQLRDTPDELACVADVVLSPVVREDVKRVLVIISSRIGPVAGPVTRVTPQRQEQVSIDINFGQQAREFHRLDDLTRNEIVTIRRKVWT